MTTFETTNKKTWADKVEAALAAEPHYVGSMAAEIEGLVAAAVIELEIEEG